MKEDKKVALYTLLILVVVFLELLFFNYRTWQSQSYQEVLYPLEVIRTENVQAIEDGYCMLTGEDGTGRFILHGLDKLLGEKRLENVWLNWELPQAQDTIWAESGICRVHIYAEIKGNNGYRDLGEHVFREDIPESRFLWIHDADRIETLVLETGLSEGNLIRIKGITVNAQKKLHFSPGRCIAAYIILALFASFRRSSQFWKWSVCENRKRELFFAVLLGMILILPACILNGLNPLIQEDMHFRPYQDLAEALDVGQPYLLMTPSEGLMALENPYDFTMRDAAGLVDGVDYPWDTVYFKGHYYTYFGVVPCILFYLPYYHVFGTHLPDATVILLSAVFLYAGIYLLVRKWLCWRNLRLPYAYQLLITCTVFMGSCIVTCMGSPDAHDVPRVVGMTFVVWGLYFWWCSIRREPKRLRLLPLGLGSLCMALAVGCRPNQLLFSFMALPLFWDFCRTEEGYGAKERLQGILTIIIPYLPVAAGLMFYNAVRFGSITDFGYAYNLTVLDYTQPDLFLDRIVIGIYEFLFRIPRLEDVFPFLQNGVFIQENRFGHGTFYYAFCYGGLLVCNLYTVCIPAALGRCKERKYCIWMILLIFGDMLVNAGLAGVAYHYIMDFATFLLLLGWAGVLNLEEKLEEGEGRRVFRKYLILICGITCIFHAGFYFVSNMNAGNTSFYYRIISAARFW
ncbi:MAG: hypothetical protein K6B69_14985 [Lachnospiraceae bacterium]|nr:hypothetical protein [Lachnospiraceae bacterium]